MNTASTVVIPLGSDAPFSDMPMDEGVDTRALRPGDRLSIRTVNSVYELRLDDPGHGRGVAIGNGEFINDEARASLIGATLTGRGSMVKVGWVLLGLPRKALTEG